jgi:hypothetical protein
VKRRAAASSRRRRDFFRRFLAGRERGLAVDHRGPQLQQEDGLPQTRCRCYETFYGRKLRVFIISWSVGPFQAFPA